MSTLETSPEARFARSVLLLVRTRVSLREDTLLLLRASSSPPPPAAHLPRRYGYSRRLPPPDEAEVVARGAAQPRAAHRGARAVPGARGPGR